MNDARDVPAAADAPESPEIPRRLDARARFVGAVDYLEASAGIRGWLIDTASPGSPPVIEMRCGTVPLARAYAMMERPDIDRAAGRLTHCGFLIGWSWVDVCALEPLARDPAARPITFVVAETGGRVPVVCEMPDAPALLDLVRASPLGDRQAAFREVSDFREVVESGLFDAAWYRARQGERLDPGMPAALDYLRRGEAAGERPNFYFDPAAYAREHGLPSPAGALLHHIRARATGGLSSLHFDERWYRRRHDLPRGQLALAHYLAHRRDNGPNPFFDPDHYRRASGLPDLEDPYEHFVTVGLAAGLMPSAAIAARADGAELPPGAATYLAALRRQMPAPVPPPEGLEPSPARPPEPRPAAEPPPPAAAAPAAAQAGSDSEATEMPAAVGTALPPAARLGHAAVRAWLAGLSPTALSAALAEAEGRLRASPAPCADAALILAIARQMNGQPEAAAEAAAAYFAAPASIPPEVADATADCLLADTHRLYKQQRRDLADAVYRAAYHAGRRDYLALQCLIEVGVERAEPDRIAPIADEFEQRFGAGLDGWGAIALARYHLLVGDRARARRLLLGVPPLPAVEAAVEAAVLHGLAEAGAVEEVAARLEASAAHPSPELFGVRFRLAVLRRDAQALLAALGDPRAEELRGWQLYEAMARLTETGALPPLAQGRVLQGLYRLAERRGVEDRSVVQARILFLMHDGRWDDLGALFRQIEGLPLAEDRAILLRRLEYCCLSDDAPAAERLYREHFRDRPLTKWEGLTVMRLLSELRRWDEAAATLRAHAARGFGFGGAGHVGMRIVRRAGIHEAVIATADAVKAPREPDLESFIARVREDLALQRTARVLSANRDMVAGGVPCRSNWVLESATEATEGSCIFLCTNRRYFLSLLTFLCSCLGQAPQVGGRLFVFLDADVPRHWHGAIALVGARFGRAVEIVTEPQFLPHGVEHRVDYGFFAGGSDLSRAAYLRLYAARWLLARHRFRRAAYIDADTICRGDLSAMFSLDLGDALIAAAAEDLSPHVVKAASRNGLDPRAYFNSGVLMLKCDDPELPERIEEAIRVSEQEPHRLVFQDQCALNIAFQGRVASLPGRYNFFLRPSRERNGFIEDGVILHFLDKPKPWDIVFDRTYREEWRVWALILGSILPQPLYVDIFAEANRD